MVKNGKDGIVRDVNRYFIKEYTGMASIEKKAQHHLVIKKSQIKPKVIYL